LLRVQVTENVFDRIFQRVLGANEIRFREFIAQSALELCIHIAHCDRAHTALRNGNYVNVPLDVTRQGVKRVDVASLYDSDSYLPKIRHVDGKPMFLY